MRNVLLSLLTSVSLMSTATSAFAMLPEDFLEGHVAVTHTPEANNPVVTEHHTLAVHAPVIAEITEKDQKPLTPPKTQKDTSGILSLTPDLWSGLFPYLRNPGVVFQSNTHFNKMIVNNVHHIKPKYLNDNFLLHYALELTNLRSLNARYACRITDASLSKLPQITSLDASHNEKITDASLSELTNLTRLILSRNNIITKSLSALTNLTDLNLSENTKIFDLSISHLTKITSLDLSCNYNITGNSLSALINLNNLSLSENNMIHDRDIVRLPNLTSLNLNANRMINPEALFSLTNLRILDCLCNTKEHFAVLSSHVTNYPHLRDLQIRDDGHFSFTKLGD